MADTMAADSAVSEASRLAALVDAAYRMEDYATAIRLKKQQLDILREKYGEADSTYIDALVYLARYQFRNGQVSDAVTTSQLADSLYSKNISATDRYYSVILDNQSFYLSSAGRFAEAEAKGRKALSIYETLQRNDIDMYVILMHLAEACFSNKNYADAIRFQVRCLSIVKALHGEHSEQYVTEAGYLADYYEANGDEVKASKVRERQAVLEHEVNEGYFDIPEVSVLTSEDKCRLYEYPVYKCARFFLFKDLKDPGIPNAVAFFKAWLERASYFRFKIGKLALDACDGDSSSLCMTAYKAAGIAVAMECGHGIISVDDHVKVMEFVIDFYKRNKKFTGRLKGMDAFVKAKRKGRLAQLVAEYISADQSKTVEGESKDK